MTINKKNSQDPPDFWSGDYLNRKDIARYLTKFLQSRYSAKKSEGGFVMAINADWGFGKTFLLTRWCDELRHLGYPTVYFDAWQNDFTPEPLVAFIAKMDEALSEHFRSVPAARRLVRAAIQKVTPLLKPAGIAVLGAALKITAGVSIEKFVSAAADSNDGDAENEGEKVEKGIKALEESLGKAIKSSLVEHQTKSKSIVAFKEKLDLLVNALEKQNGVYLPILFFVDELDRCRPDYAIELIEGIKHLFGVRGIYFVIGTNITELSHSIKAVYGEQFSAEKYLKRFFDFQFNLPEPAHDDFTKYLFNEIAVPTELVLLDGLDTDLHGKDPEILNTIVFETYARAFGLGLRDREAVMRILQGSFAAFTGSNVNVHIHFLYYLAIFSFSDPTGFRRLRAQEVKGNLFANEHLKNATKFAAHRLQSNIGQRRFQKGVVEPAAIISDYFSYSQMEGIAVLEKSFDEDSFPGRLFAQVRRECLNVPQLKRDRYRNSLSLYIDIVQFAGNFVSRATD